MGKHDKKTGKGRLDKYYHLAKDQGFRARSAFKLVQLNKKFSFLENARVCIDLCAAPGGWLQVASKAMPNNSIIIGVDLMPIKPIPRVITYATDITTPLCRQQLNNELKGWQADVILHDGAPNVGTAWVQDAFAQSELVLMSLKLAVEFLIKGGTFVTKVFRSKDYNNLLWVFKQLFRDVEATKPPSSRNVSAEIFVVCKDFIAPQRIDPRFLDPKHVFKDLAALSTDTGKGSLAANAHANVYMPEKNRRKREGYEEGNYTLYKEIGAMEFIESNEPVNILGTYNKITFKTDDELKLLKNEDTTSDIKANCEDLKVLGKKEFKQLMKWRLIIREEMGLDVKENKKKNDETEEQIEVLPVDEDEQIAEDIERVENEEKSKARRERRKVNERRAREVQRMQLKMGAPLDIGLEQIDDIDDVDVNIPGQRRKQDMFDLKHSKKHLKGKEIDEMDEDDAESSDEDEQVNRYEDVLEDGEDRLARLEAQMDGMYEQYQDQLGEKDRKHKVKEQRRKDKNREAWGGIRDNQDEESDDDDDEDEDEDEESEGERGYHAKEKRRAELDEDSSSDESVYEKPVKKHKKDDLDDDKKASANIWFDNPLFKDVKGIEESDSENENDDDESENDEKEESDDGFEVVPQEDDGTTWDVDDEDLDAARQKKIEDTGLITEEAMSMAYRLKNGMTTKSKMIDDGFNKQSFNEKTGLPDWFADDENKHYKVHVPITKEAVEALKARQRAVDARPIKKIAEAKAKKKHKEVKAIERAQAKAETVMENQELTEKEKAMGVQKLINKGKSTANKKREVKLVVAKGTNKGVKGRPKGVSGRYRMVDRRFKSDIRGMRNAKRRSINNKKRRNKK